MPVFPRKKVEARVYTKKDPIVNNFLHTDQWRKIRAIYIMSNPVCEVHANIEVYIDCSRNAPVDHIIPRKIGGAECDDRNLMTLCPSCHNYKTGLEMHRELIPPSPESIYPYLYPTAEAKQSLINRLSQYL